MDASTSTAVASPTTGVVVSNDNSTKSTITITAKDAGGAPTSGRTVNVSVSGSDNYINGTLSSSMDLPAQTDASGVATFELSSTKAETKTVTVVVDGVTLTQKPTVAFTAGAAAANSTVVQNPVADVPADGATTANILVTLKDQFGNTVPGKNVTLESDGTGNTVVSPASATNAGGQTTGTIASTKAETKTVTAKVDGASVGTASVNFVAGPAANFSVSADSTKLASQGKGSTFVRIEVEDANGNLVTTDAGKTFTFSVAPGTYLALKSGNTDVTASGKAEIEVITQGGLVPDPPTVTNESVFASCPDFDGGTPKGLNITIVNFSINVDTVGGATPGVFLDGTGVHLVTSGSTPSTAGFSGAGGSAGDYRWSLASVGSINPADGVADSITYTAPATITGDNQKDTLTLKNSADTLSSTIDITVYNTVAVTPSTAIGILLGATGNSVAATGGTKAYGYQTDDAAVLTVDAATGAITTVAAGTCTAKAWDSTYGAYATDNGFRATTASIDVLDLQITNCPTALESKGTYSFTSSGSKTAGEVNWEASAGTIDVNGNFTAPEVTSGNTVVTITVYDKTYNKTHATPVMKTCDVTVYTATSIAETPAGYDDAVPSTYPMLAAGASLTLNAKDTTKTYEWTVKDWNDTQIGTTAAGTSLTLNNADYPDAGVYTLTLKDTLTMQTATLKIRVPMDIVATKSGTNTGPYTDKDGTDTFTVNKGPAASAYMYTAKDSGGVAVTAANCGTFADASPTDNTNVFNFTNGIPDTITFKVTVSLDSSSTDPDVLRLIAAGLGEITSGNFTVVPIISYSGKVVDAGTSDPVAGATVTAVFDPADTTTTAADGTFTTAEHNKTGAEENFAIVKTGYYPKTVTGTQITAGDIELQTLTSANSISGTLTLAGDTAPFKYGLCAVKVKTAGGTYIQDQDNLDMTVYADQNTGTYSFQVPDIFATEGPFTVVGIKDGYLDGSATGVTLPSTTANIELKPVTHIKVTPTAQGAPDQVLLTITAEAGEETPMAFDGTTSEIELTVNGSTVTPTFGSGAWTYTHGAYESFSINVKADVGEDRDVNSSYTANKEWCYVKSETAPNVTVLEDPGATGGTALSLSGNTKAEFPAGSFSGEYISRMSVTVAEADATEAGATKITGSDMAQIDLTGHDGGIFNNANLGRAEITMKFDTASISSGDFENGNAIIYKADNLCAMVAGTALTQIPKTQIVSADYAGGYVTFYVDSLSAFGIAAESPAPTISYVSPGSETSLGGASVTITGTNFVTGATVTFGGNIALDVVVVNSTTITCKTPSHAKGVVTVVVKNPDNKTATGSYEYGYNPAPTTTTVAVTDTTPPVITLIGDDPMELCQNAEYVEPGATAQDNWNGNVTSKINIDDSKLDVTTPGTYEVVYTVSDNSGNSARKVRKVIVAEDTTPPVISITGSTSVEITVGDGYTDSGATATDACDGTVEVDVTSNNVDTSAAGDYQVVYSATDKSGNVGTATRNVKVVATDTTAPVITITGANPATILVGGTYTESGATASDNVDGTVAVTVQSSNVNTAVVGEYQVVYVATDAAGNSATATRTVSVVDTDTVPPAITITGDNPATVVVGNAYTDAGATAVDGIDGAVAVTVTENTVNTSVLGEYYVTYSATDNAGNTATATRNVNVVEDGTPAAPTQDSPADGAVEQSLTLTLRVTGAGSFSSFLWEIALDESFTDIILSEMTDGTFFTVPALFLNGNLTYYWRVRGQNAAGIFSAWSDIMEFTTVSVVVDDEDGNGVPDSLDLTDPSVDLDGNGVPDMDQNGQQLPMALFLNTLKGNGVFGVKGIQLVEYFVSLIAIEEGVYALPSGVGTTFGLFGYKFTVTNPGDTATVEVHYSEAAPAGVQWLIYNNLTGVFDVYSNPVFGADRTSFTFDIQDGGPWDADGLQNGIVVVSASGLGTPGACVANAYFIADPKYGDSPLTVRFDASNSTADTYSWNFGDGSGGSSTIMDHVYPTSGTYTVKLTVTSEGGCTDSMSKTITVVVPASGDSGDDNCFIGASSSGKSFNGFLFLLLAAAASLLIRARSLMRKAD